MILARKITFFSAFLLAVATLTAGRVIDQESSPDIGTIAQELCNNPSSRISRLSTVEQLVDYYDSARLSEAGLAECEAKYQGPMYDLLQVIQTGSDNVCGHEKVSKIAEFHWNYIIGSLSKKWSKTSKASIPDFVRDFFIDYSSEIMDLCKRNVLRNLDLATADSKTIDGDKIFAHSSNKKIESLRTIVVPKSKIRNYEDFSLPWEMIINQLKRRGDIPESLIDESGDLIVAVLKMRDPQSLLESQRVCRFDLRPIYQQTVLPVMRLIDMGYGSIDKSLEEEVSSSELLKNWYEITQICELLLPIYVHKDETLGQNEAVLVNTEEEFDKIFAEAEPPVAREQIPSTTNVDSIQLDDTIKSALSQVDEKQLLKAIKSNIKDRAQIYRKLTKNVARNVKDKVKSTLKGIFVSRKSRSGAVIKEQPDHSNLEKSLDELLGEDLDEHVRHKRAPWDGPKKQEVDPPKEAKTLQWANTKQVLKSLLHIGAWVFVISAIVLVIVGLAVLGVHASHTVG